MANQFRHWQNNPVVTEGGAPAMSNSRLSCHSFEYTGDAVLTVIGSVTGRRYRFNKTGDTQLVDPSDALDMNRLYLLRKLN